MFSLKWYMMTILLFLTIKLCSQEELYSSRWEVRGYVKNLQTTIFAPLVPGGETTMLNDLLLHQRLNVVWFGRENFRMKAALRNRIFWGDQVRFTLLTGGDFIRRLDAGSDDFFDWSAGYQNNKGYALHTTLDRFYTEWTPGFWELRLGRQRINWGITTTWNPNDIFNTFNFVDFDYEERPGSDALLLKRYIGSASGIEIAMKAARNWNDFSAAVLYKFHTGTYDWQLLSGIMDTFLVAGGGWAGNLGNAGFKGEFSGFFPLQSSGKLAAAATFGIDYTLANGMYLNAGFLYNSSGAARNDSPDFFNFQLSARNLYPYRYAILMQGTYPVSPLLNTSVIVIYSPVWSHVLFLNPVVSCSLAQNWDLDLLGQVLFQRDDRFRSPVQAFFLRVKFSF